MIKKDTQRDNIEITIEITFDEIILDDELYQNVGAENNNDVNNFKKGDTIIYFRGNNTWRAEVVGFTKNGYLVSDY